MYISILSLQCICWLLVYGPSPCQSHCLAVPSKISYSSFTTRLDNLEKGVNSPTYWCSAGSIFVSKMDLTPFIAVSFKNKLTIVGVGLKGGPAILKYFGFMYFQVFTWEGHNQYNAIREGSFKNRKIKNFPGLTEEDIEKGIIKDYMFAYPVQTDKMKVFFKLRLGHDRICLRIQFYQNPESCGTQPEKVNRCNIENGGCEHTCHKMSTSFYCSCKSGYSLWRNGLNCVPEYNITFKTVYISHIYEVAEAQCFKLGGFLATAFSKEEYDKVGKSRLKWKHKPYYIGVVDVDQDQSYKWCIDGSDVVFIAFSWTRTNPGSTGIFVHNIWITDYNYNGQKFICRISDEDLYLLTGYLGIEDYQLSSSQYLKKTSLASSLAFGPARSRRGSKTYLSSDSGIEYGSFWRPDIEVNKYLRLTTNTENKITGVMVLGVSCISVYVKFQLKHKTFNEKMLIVTKQYTVPSDSDKLIFIKPPFKATQIELTITDDTICDGYQWDLVGRPTGLGFVDECQNKPCDHFCINTPESFYCRCMKNYHLFIDGRTCLPDSGPYFKGLVHLALDYYVFKNALQSFPQTAVYYEFFSEPMNFSSASQICREYGGFLPSIHMVSEQRLMYPELLSYPSCTKWLLSLTDLCVPGLRGTSLMHSAWQDGSWLDFALFDGAVSEIAFEEQVVYMDKSKDYLWKYTPDSMTSGCFICQYKQHDCSLAILKGLWTIPQTAWTISENLMEETSVESIVLNLPDGLKFFHTIEPQGYVQVDLQQDFILHLMKCSSVHGDRLKAVDNSQKVFLNYAFYLEYSVDIYERFLFIKDHNGQKMTFSCGSSGMIVKSTILRPPVLAQFVKISWSFPVESVYFSLKLELYGCPAYTPAGIQKNPQCGTKSSLYTLVSHESYMCMYSTCPLTVETCGPFQNYYIPNYRSENICSAEDACASMPCNDGTICLNYRNSYTCHCPRVVEGNCSYVSDMYVMTEQRLVLIDETVTIYLVIKKPNRNTVYSVHINEYSCIPDLHTIDSSAKGQYWCGTVKYHATTGGVFKVIAHSIVNRTVRPSNTVEFRVTYPDSVTKNCLTSLHINRAAYYLHKAYTYHRGQELNFIVAAAAICNKLEDFKITEYNWTFSLYKFDDPYRCYSDDDFSILQVPGSTVRENGEISVPKRILPLGYIKVCLKVKMMQRNNAYTKMSCGFLKIIVVPLKCIIIPSSSYLSVPANKPFVLNASESVDPNTGDSSGINYLWYCSVKNSSDSCELLSDHNMTELLVFTGSVLVIPAHKLKINQTYLLTLEISKANVTGSNKSVTVEIVSSYTPRLQIRCVFNCKEVVAPAKMFALNLDCDNCESENISLSSVEWTLSSQTHGIIPFSTWGPNSTTGNKKQSVVLMSDVLNVSDTYMFIVKGYTKKGSLGKAVYEFITNSPPVDGSCFIFPKSGKALITYFTVVCPGYYHPQGSLKYRIHLKKKNNIDTLLYYGNENSVNFFQLPTGPKDDDFRHILTISISDSLETSALSSVSIQVFSPQQENKNAVKFLENVIMNLVSDVVTLHDDIYNGFLQLAINILEMLGNEENTIANSEKRHLEKKICKQILKNLDNVQIKDKESLSQMTDIVADIIFQEDEISYSMKKLFLNVALKMADSLSLVSKSFPTSARNIARKQSEIFYILMNLLTDQEEEHIVANWNKMKYNVNKLLNVFEKLSDAVLNSIIISDEEPFVINKKQLTISLKWSKSGDEDHFLAVQLEGTDERSYFSLPSTSIFYGQHHTSFESLNIQMMILKKNPFMWSTSVDRMNLPVVKVVVKNRKKTKPLRLSNLTSPAEIFIPVMNQTENATRHMMNISLNPITKEVIRSSALHLIIPLIKNKVQLLKISPVKTTLKLHVLVQNFPADIRINSIEKNGSNWPIREELLLKHQVYNQDPNILLLPENSEDENQTSFHIGIRVQPGQEVSSEMSEVEVDIQTFSVECSYWNEVQDEWQTFGCKVGHFTTLKNLHCMCNHLTAFSGGIFAIPNIVDHLPDAPLTMAFFDNPVVITVVTGVWIIYFILLAWAFEADNKDSRKIGITVLTDNNPDDTYSYLICVVTGWRHNAGTTSNVFMYLCGKKDKSEGHALADGTKALFTPGAENWFLLRTKQSLGSIISIVIWHDCSGSSPSWYLREVLIMDIESEKTWHCINDKWLSVDPVHGHGLAHAEIPALESTSFKGMHMYHFAQSLKHHFSNKHLWISIFMKHPVSAFSRKRRLTCALCFLFSTLFINITFHGIPEDDPSEQIYYRDYQLSLTDFIIGIQSSLLTSPVTTLIIFLFFAVESKPDRKEQKSSKYVAPIRVKTYSPEETVCCMQDHRFSQIKKRCKFKRLPWYFVFVVYAIAVTLTITCSYYVLLYGLKFGYNRSLSWLISFFTSFFFSVVILEPLKVFVFAVLFAFILKQKVNYNSKRMKKIYDKEKLLLKELNESEGYKSSLIYPPLFKEEISEKADRQVILQQYHKDVLQEIAMYFTFLTLISLVLLGNNSVTQSYQMTKNIYDVFIDSSYDDHHVLFYQVTNSQTMWKFLNVTFLAKMMSGEHRTIANSVAYLIGRARLRQSRIHKQESCFVPAVLKRRLKLPRKCLSEFTYSFEETQDFTKNWHNVTVSNSSSLWTYQSSSVLETLPLTGRLASYPGGGYVVEIPRNITLTNEALNQVKQTAWIDEHTRIVFFEFTVYNPSVNLFSLVILMFEYSNNGFIFPYHYIYTTHIYNYENMLQVFINISKIFLVFVLLSLTYAEVKKCCFWGSNFYLSNIWSYVELIILCLAYSAVGLYIVQLVMYSQLQDKLKNSDSEIFISFHTAIFYNFLFQYVMAVLLFFMIVKIMKFFHFSKRLAVLAETFYTGRGKLFAFSIELFGFVIAFSIFAVFILGHTLEGYRNIQASIITLFVFMLRESDFYGVKQASPFLGPLFFVVFIMSFHFVLMHCFFLLLKETFHLTKKKMKINKTRTDKIKFSKKMSEARKRKHVTFENV